MTLCRHDRRDAPLLGVDLDAQPRLGLFVEVDRRRLREYPERHLDMSRCQSRTRQEPRMQPALRGELACRGGARMTARVYVVRPMCKRLRSCLLTHEFTALLTRITDHA